jgi:hypothetical protein
VPPSSGSLRIADAKHRRAIKERKERRPKAAYAPCPTRGEGKQAALPELALKAGYQIAPRRQIVAGYDLLY